MYQEQPNVATLIGEQDGQDSVLKCFPISALSGLTQTLDPEMLTNIGVVVWVSGSGFGQRFSRDGERSLEC
jgi:hypothetical protein